MNKVMVKIIKEDSIIQFSTKAFIAFIIGILSVFFGFYLLVIQPQLKNYDVKIENNKLEQKQTNEKLLNSINNLNISIATLTESINNLKNSKK